MRNRKPHIGIVGCSAEGAALCYRTLCLEGSEVFGRHGHPEVSMHTHCLADYMIYVERGDWQKVAELMLDSADKLHKIGTEILICPDNTIHQAMEYVAASSPLPWIHIADTVVKVAKAQGMTQLGILGTKFLMEGPVYREFCEKYGLKHAVPGSESRQKINQIIFDELVNGIITEQSQKYFHACIDDLNRAGCNGVVLGCTEIPLIVDPKKSSLPTFDSTRLMAREALKRAKGNYHE